VVSRLTIAVVVAVLAGGIAQPSLAATCTGAQIATGNCSVGGNTTDGGVDLWGDLTTDGSDGDAGGDVLDECPVVVNGRCEGTSPPKDGVSPTSVHDIETFRPRTPAQFVEPGGWSLQHIPTNFWSTITAHVVSGELLGNPAEVRFTPIRYRRYFGDGQRQTTDRPGETWRELGQPAWTRTRTSHAYRDADTYQVRLLVWFSAEFRFGAQDWRPLDGLVTAHANDVVLSVLNADTVLVDRDCAAGAIGCERLKI
jgi:hypothetical protein